MLKRQAAGTTATVSSSWRSDHKLHETKQFSIAWAPSLLSCPVPRSHLTLVSVLPHSKQLPAHKSQSTFHRPDAYKLYITGWEPEGRLHKIHPVHYKIGMFVNVLCHSASTHVKTEITSKSSQKDPPDMYSPQCTQWN